MSASAFCCLSSCFWVYLESVSVEEGRLCPKGGDAGGLDTLLFSRLVALVHPRGDGIPWAKATRFPYQWSQGLGRSLAKWISGPLQYRRQILVFDTGLRFETYCVILARPG